MLYFFAQPTGHAEVDTVIRGAVGYEHETEDSFN